VRIVGIGAYADRGAADDFRRVTGVASFPLLWAPDAAAWAPFDVLAQPYAVLLVDGEVVDRWSGRVSLDRVEAAAATARR
jgi:hypothetical protein